MVNKKPQMQDVLGLSSQCDLMRSCEIQRVIIYRGGLVRQEKGFPAIARTSCWSPEADFNFGIVE